jgi:outer membrane protein OmpA-like peptidoglycan-associated protein
VPITPKGPAEAPAKPVTLVPMPKAPSAPIVPVETNNAAPAPAAATAPAPTPAATPPAPAAAKGKADLVIVFKATETSLPLSMKEQVDAMISKLKADETLRVNLIAYASAGADQASTVRRVSLSRALSVRAYLIDNGIGNLRINVQAEGDKNPGGEPDRVDMFLVK